MQLKKYIGILVSMLAGASILAAADKELGAQIRVVTDPPEAVVYCDGVLKDPAPLVISDLSAGDHLVTAIKQGYRDARKTVSLMDGQKAAIELKLEPVNGLVLVYSSPSGADIQIDGADRGKTPLLVHNLPLGKYRLKVNSQGYAAKEIDLIIKDRVPLKLDINLSSDSAMIDLSSQPAGADVTLNGIAKGKTPCVIDRIPAGTCQLELIMDGYAPYKQTLNLQAGQQEKMTAIMKAIPSELQVVSIPAKARIYVENQFRGESPVTLQNLEPGEYRIRAELIGCEPVARTVKLERNQKLVEEFRLTRDCGVMEITTEPAGVKVLLDGKESGVTAAKAGETDRVSEPLTIDFLSAGAHQVQLTKKGYYDASFEVQIEKEKTVTKHVPLKQRFIPDCEVRTTKDEVFRGVLVDADPQGNIRLEIKPGIFKNIPAKEVKMRLPIRVDKSAEGQP